MNKSELIELVEGIAYDLDRIKAYLKNEQYELASEFTDGIVNDAEILRESIGGKALKKNCLRIRGQSSCRKVFIPTKYIQFNT